jgi:hypothetical protein
MKENSEISSRCTFEAFLNDLVMNGKEVESIKYELEPGYFPSKVEPFDLIQI